MSPKEYESLVHEVMNISDRTRGRQCLWHEREASTIFIKIGITSFSTLFFIPETESFNGKIWDISSLATLSRSILESYLSMYYIAIESLTDEERDFRRLLWEYHREQERLSMLKASVPDSSDIPTIKTGRDDYKKKLKENQLFLRLDVKTKKRLLKGKEKGSQQNIDICQKAGISQDFYRGIYKYLSSFSHTTPLGLSVLYELDSQSKKTQELIKFIVFLNSGILSLAIRDYTSVFRDQKNLISQKINELIEFWEYIFKWDFSSIEKSKQEYFQQSNPPYSDTACG
jgi:hypothetical protein